jgi:hypothetical protein
MEDLHKILCVLSDCMRKFTEKCSDIVHLFNVATDFYDSMWPKDFAEVNENFTNMIR